MAITPSSFSLEVNDTQLFSVSGFGGSKWGVRSGVGSFSTVTNGLFQAGAVAGSSTVRVMTDMWSTVPAGLDYNTNNNLTVNTASPGLIQPLSYARLTAAGDEVEFVWSNKFAPMIKDSGQYWILYQGLLYHVGSVTLQHTPSPAFSNGDICSFVLIGSNQLGLKRNGVLIHTLAQTVGASLQPAAQCESAATTGDVLQALRFSGSGITGYSELTASGSVLVELLTPRDGCQLYVDAGLLTGLSDNGTVSSFTDQSGYGRHLTAASSQPVYKTAIVNGKPVIRWDGTKTPLSNSTNITFRCGWIVAKFNGSSFSAFKGLFSGQNILEVLKSNSSGTVFTPNGAPFFEYRVNDLICPESDMQAPMNAFKVIFFRFWETITIDGPQLGQNRNQTGEKWNGDVALLCLYSNDFLEDEIRTHTESIANNFALTLAEVYPYQADAIGPTETVEQTINIYDPPEGDRITEAIGDAKRVLDLKFSVADQIEVGIMKAFHAAKYATGLPCFYRDYRPTPPEDIEGYIDSPYELIGSGNEWYYSFRFREK
jgi:hypothetical protein